MQPKKCRMESSRQVILILLFLFFLSGQAAGLPFGYFYTSPGSNFQGLPFIQNFNPKEYLHLTPSFEHSTILQDNRGVMLIGSHGGILQYNGTTWQFIQIPGSNMVWGLGKDKSGRIYVGASDNLGYLAPDVNGKIRFVSLLSKLPKNMRTLGDVWDALVTPEGVYFKSNQYLLRWHQGKFKVWQAETAFGLLQWLNNKLHVQVADKGLFVLQNNALQLFSDDTFFTEGRLQFLLPLKDKRWLVANSNSGLAYFTGKTIVPVQGAAAIYLRNNVLFQGKLLPDSNVAITTLKGGVVILDQAANIKTIVNQESGLVTNTTYSLGTDDQGGLWISLEKGLSRIRLNSPFSYFNERVGLQRQTYAVCEHQGQLFAGTTAGLFQLTEKLPLNPSASFRNVAGFTSSIWSLQSIGISLLIGSEEGLFEWRNGKITALPITVAPWDNYCRDIQPSKYDSTVVFIASKNVYAFRRVGNQWRNEGALPGLPDNISQLIESPIGDLWLPTRAGITRVQFPEAKLKNGQAFTKNTVINRYGPAQGVPAGITNLYYVGQDLIAQIGEGNYQLFRFREDRNVFEPLKAYETQFNLPRQQVQPATEYSDGGQVWLWTKKYEDQRWQLQLARKQPNGTYTTQSFDFSGSSYPLKQFVYQQAAKAVWFSGVDGLVRFEWPAAEEKSPSFFTLLRRVVLPSGSVLYSNNQQQVQLPFRENSLHLELAAPSYNGAENNKFQFWLEGYDKNWSAWTKESVKEYTRLPEGTYTFHARAVNAQGHLGRPVSYTFTILPPWPRTWFMYGLYLLGAGILFWLLVRWRSAKLKAEKEQLEKLVAQRTQEVALKNEQLRQQAEELAAQTEKLQELDQVKSHFFANISHEFRTPLTLILNNVLDKLSGTTSNSEQTLVPVKVSELKVMSRNARRLLQLINQLLDLSKIESGQLLLEQQTGDFKQLLKVIYSSFSSLADYQHIKFELQLPDEPLVCRYDEDKVEKILYNLLSNAFKFTPNGGKVFLKTELLPVTNSTATSVIQITVQDSGPGLNPEQLNKVFERFYQGQQYYADAQGTGIGLALAKELTELQQGRIWAESEPGKGAAFIVQLPFISTNEEVLSNNKGTLQKEVFSDLSALPEKITSLPEVSKSPVTSNSSEELPLILVVEDNDDLRAYICAHLEGSYRVVESINGVQGLTVAQETIPDLIITDWMMPEMDGIALCGQLKTDMRTSHIPVIMLTALTTAAAKVKGLETGADDYLTKPFDSKELVVRIANLVENRRKLREYFSREIRLEPTKMVVSSVDEKFLQQVMRVVEERLSDSEFSVDEFSREIGLSRVHLHRKLKALTGQSPSDFIRMMRLKQAAQLLEARAGNIAEIAYQVGFNNLSYFSKCFREQFGVLPNEYIARQPANS
ncbi:hybrid sensor histidine kinase/response regulator transcription factor [Adhaeribacter radiodurans]|uniref:histidine kinase n=1 Tax=Adhaeribacter radiodurans TaxID=2745197 RepID=A0A7L7L1P2_9BACT|nr:hybrid sensor histidine kinase/response regulator transcription factor [Adhaeribacter radiodurans]QMU26707.1 response regulator [Adhaeribacter radiodurans]